MENPLSLSLRGDEATEAISFFEIASLRPALCKQRAGLRSQ